MIDLDLEQISVVIVDLSLEVRGKGTLLYRQHSFSKYLQPIPFKLEKTLIEFLELLYVPTGK